MRDLSGRDGAGPSLIIEFTIRCCSVSVISLMELREFAERVLFSLTLEEKLACPPGITDEQPGTPLEAPEMPGRPPELRFKPRNASRIQTPGLHELEQTGERGRLLHFFANHELLATELMALALLRFPDAPAAFRRGVLQTLQQEQQHTAWYIRRMKECGICFGELPVSGYFWRSISPMRDPLDYLAGLSLTFEQANLDFTRFFSSGFAKVGDAETSRLLDRIYQDEIGHVAYGLKWFRKWKDPQQSDWDAFCRQLRFPMSAQRAKGPVFNIEGRLAAGLDRQFIDELNVYAQSKGRTPGVFIFNPFAEGRIAHGKSFTPNLHQQQMQQDLENLPQFLCRQDDVVLVGEQPSVSFMSTLKAQGWVVPEFVTLKAGRIDAGDSILQRKLGKLSPWAWGPDSQEVLAPLFTNITAGSRNPGDYYNEKIAQLYSKAWSADLLRTVLNEMRVRNDEPLKSSADESHASGCELASLLCTRGDVGVAASTVEEVLRQINAVRGRGHHNVLIKEAIGVAGHNAIRLLEPDILDTQKRWIAAAVDGRQVVVEPWLDRELDFSVQLEMSTAGLKLVGYTGLSNDWKGQFRGNWAWPGFHNRICLGFEQLFPDVPDIVNRVRYVYSEIFLVLDQDLRKAGYLGPVGIDAFVYRTPQGQCRLKPVVEINPRYTMGRLTLELMKNVAPGKTGTLSLINRRQLRSEGFKHFAAWAGTASERCPVRLEGNPVPKLVEGFVCLNDPARAEGCLAVFNVV